MRLVFSVLSLSLLINYPLYAKTPSEIFREKFQRAKENPSVQDLKVGKQWDCYFIGVGSSGSSYSASYRFEDFGEVIRGTYNVTKIHSYSYTNDGLMSRLNMFLKSYIRIADDGKLVIETTSSQLSHDNLQAVSNQDRGYEYALCKPVGGR